MRRAAVPLNSLNHQDKISCFPDSFDHLAKDEKNKTKFGCFATKISSFSTACSMPPTWAFLFPHARMDRWLKQPLARLSHRGFSNLPSLCSKLPRLARKQSSLQEFSHGTSPAVGKAESGNSASTVIGKAEEESTSGYHMPSSYQYGYQCADKGCQRGN